MKSQSSNVILAAALLILSGANARAEDQELQSVVAGWNSNREAASEWLEIRFKDELDRPKILWCHGKTRCSPASPFDPDHDAALPLFELIIDYTQNEAAAGTVAYYKSALSQYAAVRQSGFLAAAPVAFLVSKKGTSLALPAGYGASNTFAYTPPNPVNFDPNNIPNAPSARSLPVTIKGPELVLKRPYQYMVVAAPASRLPAQPNPMDGLARKPECRDMISSYYGQDGAALTGSQLVHRRLLPQEIEFAEAGLPGVDLAALGYSDALDAGRAGRIGEIDSFVRRFRSASRTAAQAGLAGPSDAPPADRFTPFEAGFLSCRTSYAGVRAPFFASLQNVNAGNTAAFVEHWRAFVKREFKIYLDGSTPAQLPAGPLAYKDALDLINQRTSAIQAGGSAGQDVTAPASRLPSRMPSWSDELH